MRATACSVESLSDTGKILYTSSSTRFIRSGQANALCMLPVEAPSGTVVIVSGAKDVCSVLEPDMVKVQCRMHSLIFELVLRAAMAQMRNR